MNKVVIGLGFGDEGKGQFVNHLCSQSDNDVVVRFNGGHQAGHTVEIGQGIRHVFANFGSGTLMGNSTYWSKHCIVEPVGLLKELIILQDLGIEPTLYIDADCPVTTPYDITHNMWMEDKNDHGSCGVGFGSTIEREENFYHLHFGDLFYPDVLKEKLRSIRGYYNSAVNAQKQFLDACSQLVSQKENVSSTQSFHINDGLIFEGAQGLLLDQHYGFFPNVTRSNCGTTNLPDGDYEFYLVTRCYQTRHGNGFMSNEINDCIKHDPLETNVTHEWQGEFRRGLLDINMLAYAIKKDPVLRKHNDTKYLVITCLDHLEKFCCIYNNEIMTCKNEEHFISFIEDILSKSYLLFNGIFTSKRENGKIRVKFL